MPRKRKLAVLLFLIIIIAITPVFARVKTNHFSAYAVCQKQALSIKGNKEWGYQRTSPEIFASVVYFFDGYNVLECHALGVGPFWIVFLTVWGCRGNTIEICPPDMFHDYMD